MESPLKELLDKHFKFPNGQCIHPGWEEHRKRLKEYEDELRARGLTEFQIEEWKRGGNDYRQKREFYREIGKWMAGCCWDEKPDISILQVATAISDWLLENYGERYSAKQAVSRWITELAPHKKGPGRPSK